MESKHEFDENSVCKRCSCKKPHCPEECPGEPVSDEDQAKIKDHLLDFRGSKWRTYFKM